MRLSSLRAACLVLLALLPPTWRRRPWFAVEIRTGPGWDPALAPGDQTAFAEHGAHLRDLREAGALHFGARYAELGLPGARRGRRGRCAQPHGRGSVHAGGHLHLSHRAHERLLRLARCRRGRGAP